MPKGGPSSKTSADAGAKAAPKKAARRRRSPTAGGGGRKRTKKAPQPDNPRSPTPTPPIPTAVTPPPSQILLIDNGGHTLKYGLINPSEPKQSPESIPNCTARLRHQLTTLRGDELFTVQSTQLDGLTRSTERGIIVNMGNQIQIWKRLLELLRIQVDIPPVAEVARVFGWHLQQQKRKSTEPWLYQTKKLAVVLMVPPLTPRSVLDHMQHVWFHEFGVAHVGFLTTSLFGASTAPTTPTPTQPTGCSLVVDLGWSACHVVPALSNQTWLQRTAVKRLGLGGRHLVNLWKYYITYRQWNLMDADFLLEQVQQELGYVSLDFAEELRIAERLPIGRRPFDREFVLPDYQTVHKGFAQLTPWLQREGDLKKAEQQKKDLKALYAQNSQALEQEKDGGEVNSSEQNESHQNGSDGNDSRANEDANETEESNDDAAADSDEETDDQRRQRLVQQRAQEERRRREIEAERQTLLVSVERFTIPEILFRPSDARLSPEMAGLAETIVASVQSCPRIYQSALYDNVRLIGGLTSVPNLQKRLQRELRSLIPCHYPLHVATVENAATAAWEAAREFLLKTPHQEWSVSRDEYEASLKSKEAKRYKAFQKLLDSPHRKLI